MTQGIRARLYDKEGKDSALEPDQINPDDLSDERILWVDVDLELLRDLTDLWARLRVSAELSGLELRPRRPKLTVGDNVIQLAVQALRSSATDFSSVTLHCVVGKNWVVTLHEGELDLFEEFNDAITNESQLGGLDAPGFLSVVLDWHLTGYFKVVEQLQTEIDSVDEELLNPAPNGPRLITRLYELRRLVTRLRLTLSPHRSVFGPLSHPHAEGLADSSDFERLLERLESALVEVNTAREMIAVSFDIYMAQVSKDTNDIMKRLTLLSVLLLPAVVLAGIMGMNFRVGLFDVPWLFWVTIGTMGLMAGFTLYFARRRKWL